MFDVDVYHHVTQVSKELAPTEVWSFAVNGVKHTGTGVSPPMVVNEGDMVDFTLTNGSTETMNVNLPHSLDFHSAEVNPGTRYADLAPGKSMHYRFTADHPGVFMYHCATQPVLMHTGAGMVGMFVVKPKDLAPVDKELWITQQEFYIGKPGADADMAKLDAKQPDVIAFNGYGNQYKPTRRSRSARTRRSAMYVLNAGPSIWSAFHVIGTVFDRTVIEGTAATTPRPSTSPLAGRLGRVHARGGRHLPVRHPRLRRHGQGRARRARHAERSEAAPPRHGPGTVAHDAAAAVAADVNVTLGDMWIKSDTPSIKAGKVTFAVENEGATVHGMAMALTPGRRAGRNARRQHAARQGRRARRRREPSLITADLKPGAYELVCFVPGHYAAGQKLPFEVTS